jgi:hypothetical protein
MRKLKLESLQVESFETAPNAPRVRGTVDAHARPRPTTLQTYNVDVCGDTLYFDCTLGCSVESNCTCVVTEVDCA